MHVAELGVVLFLFLIGLELNLSRLWAMRRDIFVLGTAQLVITGLLTMIYPLLVVGRTWQASLIAGLGLALSSTALVMQLLEEQGEVQTPHGQKAFAILLLQDLAVVPLLALVAILAPSHGDQRSAGVAVGAEDDRRAGGRDPGRALPAQPLLSHPGQRPRPRGHDRRRAAGGGGRRGADDLRRALAGAGRVPLGHPAGRIELPPRAGGGHRAVPRPAAGAVLHLGRA